MGYAVQLQLWQSRGADNEILALIISKSSCTWMTQSLTLQIESMTSALSSALGAAPVYRADGQRAIWFLAAPFLKDAWCHQDAILVPLRCHHTLCRWGAAWSQVTLWHHTACRMGAAGNLMAFLRCLSVIQLMLVQPLPWADSCQEVGI